MSDSSNSRDCLDCEALREQVRTLQRILLRIEATARDRSLEPEFLRRYVLALLAARQELLDDPEPISVPPLGRV